MARRDLKDAPRDGTLIRLRLRESGDFVGHYSDKWFGWVALHEIEHPLIRGDIRFAGWEPVDEAEIQRIREEMMLIRPVRRAKRQTVIVVPATPMARAEARPARVINRIVRARKPRPRR